MTYINKRNNIAKGSELEHSPEMKIKALDALEKAMKRLNDTINSACELGIWATVNVNKQMSFYESNPDSIMGVIHYMSPDSVSLTYYEMYENGEGLKGMSLPHGEVGRYYLKIVEDKYLDNKKRILHYTDEELKKSSLEESEKKFEEDKNVLSEFFEKDYNEIVSRFDVAP